METLPNLYFAGFMENLAITARKRHIWSRQLDHDRLVRSRQGIPHDQQFLSHDLSKHVSANLLDKDHRSRQRIEVMTRSDTGAKRKLLQQKTGCRDREKA